LNFRADAKTIELGIGKIEVRQLKSDLTPVAGLALVGDHFNCFEPVLKLLDKPPPVRAGVANSDIASQRPRTARARQERL